MKATVLYQDCNGGELIEINDHTIQYSGAYEDGYCYAHNSFECIENLTDGEKWAVKNAEHYHECHNR